MDEQKLIRLIEKYLEGRCTEEEKEQVEQWYAAQNKVSGEFYENNPHLIKTSAERSLAAILEKIKPVNAEVISIRKKFSLWQVAAALLIFIIGAVAVTRFLQPAAIKYESVYAPVGKMLHIKLPDSSEVWLNAGSRLKYADNYGKHNREVYLEGEAFFDVKHDADKPFNVHAGKINTHVLGTAFSVSAYPGMLVNTITVSRGKVQVSDYTHLLGYLLPDEQIAYETTTGKSRNLKVNANSQVSWMEGKLAYTDQPMQDIAIHLQKWFGYNFIFKNTSLKATRFTASFSNTITLPKLMIVLQAVSHAGYQIDNMNKTITFL